MAQKTICQQADALFDAVAQVFAHAPTLLDGTPVILFQQAFAGNGRPTRQPAAVQEAIPGGKVLESLFVKNRRQIKFDVSLAADEGRIAQQAERQTVGHDPPDVPGAVEVFLHQGVWRHTRPARRGNTAEFLPGANDMRGRRILGLAGKVRNGKRQSVHLISPLIEARLIAQQSEERNRPGIAGDARGEVFFGKPLDTMLENAPERPGVGKRRGDFVGQTTLGVQSEVKAYLLSEMLKGRPFLGTSAAQLTCGGQCAVKRLVDSSGCESRPVPTGGLAMFEELFRYPGTPPPPRASGTAAAKKLGNRWFFLTGRRFESQDFASPLTRATGCTIQ